MLKKRMNLGGQDEGFDLNWLFVGSRLAQKKASLSEESITFFCNCKSPTFKQSGSLWSRRVE